MSREFMRRYPKSRTCRHCGKHCSNKGIKQHERSCKSRQVKARTVWMDRAFDADTERSGVCYLKHPGKDIFIKECIMLPRTAEDYDAMVKQAADARYSHTRLAGAGYVTDSESVGEAAAIAVLESIGITRPKKTKP